jgi:hypothetical protein
VLDAGMEPVPVGVSGELYLGGDGLARGYWKRPDLTAERFVPDPFGDGGGRLYRTGDLARRLEDGQIEYLGRADHQVKVRGFRIELGEIEVALCGHPAVRDAVVLAREDAPGERRLVAYVVWEAEEAAGEIREGLRRQLPEYMVPASFVSLDSLPLTPNGKVDRGALPVPEAPKEGGAAAYMSPVGEVEETVAAVWRELLGVERVGAEDNFFDLGGHSLLLAQVQDRLQALYPEAGLGIVELFEHPTVRSLAARLRRRPTATPVAPVPAVPSAERESGRARLSRRRQVASRVAGEGGRDA